MCRNRKWRIDDPNITISYGMEYGLGRPFISPGQNFRQTSNVDLHIFFYLCYVRLKCCGLDLDEIINGVFLTQISTRPNNFQITCNHGAQKHWTTTISRTMLSTLKYLYYLIFSPTVFSAVVTSVISPSPSTENCPSQTEQDPEFDGATARLEHFDYLRRWRIRLHILLRPSWDINWNR